MHGHGIGMPTSYKVCQESSKYYHPAIRDNYFIEQKHINSV